MSLVFAVLCLQWIWTWYSTYSTKDTIHSSGFTSVFHMVSTSAELHGKILFRTLCYYYYYYYCCYFYYYLFCHSLCWCSFCASARHKPCTWSISHPSQSFCSYTKRPPEDSCRSQHTDLLGLCHSSFLWYFLDVFCFLQSASLLCQTQQQP